MADALDKPGSKPHTRTMTLTRSNTRVQIRYGDTYFTGARITRQHFTADLIAKDGSGESMNCGHGGHRTQVAAAECAKKIWRKLPA